MGARFVRLHIAGFKSFADATAIEILPGLTGIVGPNGCGKSNVTEALRWAMGESNARTLRGGEMEDVIFAGAASRPGRNLAEVSLNVESDERGLPPPFAANAELQVTRRIERGGGSHYKVNGREARARDVQTLFADMASGARSSAMVSQGRVAALVNARPEERRATLEEAAGITGLHARRAEAETRLRAAEANLERAEERKGLLQGQLAGLMEQARQAARYREIAEAMLTAEANLLALQRARAMAARQQAEAALHAAEVKIQAYTESAAAARRDFEQSQAGVPALRNAESEARTRLERARIGRESMDAELRRAQSELDAALQRGEQLDRDVGHATASLAGADERQKRLDEEGARLQREAEAYPDMVAAAKDAAREAATALEAADRHAAAASEAAAAAAARGKALHQVLQQAETRLQRAQQQADRLRAERARAAAALPAGEEVERAGAASVMAADALERARARHEQAESSRAEAIAGAGAARQGASRQDAARTKLAAETAALAEVLAAGDGEAWPAMVDRLQVPAGLEAALGAALGEALEAADDPAAARHWRSLAPLPHAEMPGLRLDQAVSAPPLLQRALGATALVASEAEGDEGQGALGPGQTLVSAEGAVWRWDGYTVRAGTPTAATIRLRQRNRLAALRLSLDEAERATEAARVVQQAADRAEKAAVAEEGQARAARRTCEQDAERTRSAAQAIDAAARHSAARLADLDEQRAPVEDELRAAAQERSTLQAEQAVEPAQGKLAAAAEAARRAVAAARTVDLAASRALDGLQRAETAREARLATIGRERDDRRLHAEDLASRLTDLAARAAEARQDGERLRARAGQAQRAAAGVVVELAEAEAAHALAARAREAAEAGTEAAGAAARSGEHAVFAAREEIVRLQAAFEGAVLVGAAVESRIAERAGALPPLPAAPPEATEAAEERVRARLQRLGRERDEKGPVNLRAEIEAGTVGAEIANIEREQGELGTAIAKLRGSIGHLNREGRERLASIYESVDRNFQALFARMFGGGRAHLALVGSEDPLLAGLEIYAQPPGKKLALLSLLSGGEQALAALCLVFAVFRCNPAPLCILDEVDAPLDDANVERFCTLLADIVAETGTRFLVVTHSQLTMARMDRLYGVTMQERGVSRLLSVDLAGAVGMIEAVAAE